MPIVIKAQLQQESAHSPQRGVPGAPSQVPEEAVPLGPTGHLLQKVSLPRAGDIAALIKYIERNVGKQAKCKDKETGPK